MPKILVIDDEVSMRLLLIAALEDNGYEVVDSGSGRTGIELAQAEKPDLVLCDVGLLDTSGYEVLRALRSMPKTCNIPFVLMTGLADLQGMREGMRLGADDYMPKPFDIPEMLALVAARLRKAEQIRHEAEDKAKLLRSHISMMLPQELLSPLNGIIGLADILRDDAARIQPDEAADIGRDIQSSGERLHRLIRNFLIYSQLELLNIEPERLEAMRNGTPAQISKVIGEVTERIAEKHHRRADLVLDATAGDVAISEQNLTKLSEELIDNAFRFSEPGKPVEVRTKITGGKVWLTISDEGSGIPAEILEGLRAPDQFERLFVEQRMLGLGLSIAVKLAEVHQGRAVIQSQLGTGTSILVELPLAKTPTDAATAPVS
jgi:signal transduction histidine kinase